MQAAWGDRAWSEPPEGAAGGAADFSVLSWNTLSHGASRESEAAWRVRRHKIVTRIKSLPHDMVLLQEVQLSPVKIKINFILSSFIVGRY